MLLWAMSVIFVICVGVVMWAEVQGNPHLLALGADSSINMEGKESRFGVLVSSLFAVVTTAASCWRGDCDGMIRLPLSVAMVPMWLMQIGECGVRRCRFWSLRHDAVCPAGGVYCRADDWSYTGISGSKKSTYAR